MRGSNVVSLADLTYFKRRINMSENDETDAKEIGPASHGTIAGQYETVPEAKDLPMPKNRADETLDDLFPVE